MRYFFKDVELSQFEFVDGKHILTLAQGAMWADFIHQGNGIYQLHNHEGRRPFNTFVDYLTNSIVGYNNINFSEEDILLIKLQSGILIKNDRA